MGDHCWIVAWMRAEEKQLIRASQIAARKTPSAPESPLSLCYSTDRERSGEWDCACVQNLNTCCFVPCEKLTSAYVLKILMSDWNCSNNFDTPCIVRWKKIQKLNYLQLWYSFLFSFVLLQSTDTFLGVYHDMKINDRMKAWLHGFLTSAPKPLRWSRGSVLAFGTQVRGFTPGRSRRTHVVALRHVRES
jgi:hypothetical protein